MYKMVKFKTLALRRRSVLGGLLFAAVFALLPTLAQAQCKNWDASGNWVIEQRAVIGGVALHLEQEGKALTGKANTTVRGKPGSFLAKGKLIEIEGAVEGTIDGDSFSIQIFWNNATRGIYTAKVLPSGKLDGEAHEKSTPKILHAWHSRGVLKCAPAPVKSASDELRKAAEKKPKLPYNGQRKFEPPPSPGGSAPKSGSPNSSPPPPMKAPFIILASQATFPTSYDHVGYAVFTWDAGPDHPYAEVWFKINNGDAIFVVEQGKGSRQVTVERGKYYTYILTDAGKTLSTISFVAQ